MADDYPTALLVVGHGTRSPAGQAEYWALVEKIAEQLPTSAVEGCFLELVQPDIQTGIARLAHRGFRRIVAMPLMLFDAGHAKTDIPREARDAAEHHQVELRTTPALGLHPTMVELSRRRFEQVLQKVPQCSQDACWVFLARGSRDDQATKDARRFMAERLRGTPVAEAHLAFLAMAQPRFDEVAQRIADSPHPLVVIQPHLLFTGELFERLQRMIRRQDAVQSRQQWLLTKHLGADDLVAVTVVDRYHQVLTSQ